MVVDTTEHGYGAHNSGHLTVRLPVACTIYIQYTRLCILSIRNLLCKLRSSVLQHNFFAEEVCEGQIGLIVMDRDEIESESAIYRPIMNSSILLKNFRMLNVANTNEALEIML